MIKGGTFFMNEKTTGFQDKLMKYMMPVANWVEKNNWL